VSDAAVGDAPSDTASSPMSCGHDKGAAVEPGCPAVLDSRISSVFSRKRGVNRQAGPSVHEDLFGRQFTRRRRTFWGSPTSPSNAPPREGLLLRD
jgi:hypothetical protein